MLSKMNSPNDEVIFDLRNSHDHEMTLWLEPWGTRIDLASQETIRVVLDSDLRSAFEIEYSANAISVHSMPQGLARAITPDGKVKT